MEFKRGDKVIVSDGLWAVIASNGPTRILVGLTGNLIQRHVDSLRPASALDIIKFKKQNEL